MPPWYNLFAERLCGGGSSNSRSTVLWKTKLEIRSGRAVNSVKNDTEDVLSQWQTTTWGICVCEKVRGRPRTREIRATPPRRQTYPEARPGSLFCARTMSCPQPR